MNRAFLRVLIGGKPTGSYTVPFGETVEIRLGMAEASQVKFYLTFYISVLTTICNSRIYSINFESNESFIFNILI